MARALVTGGTGFLGSHIARALIEAGHKVRILRRAKSPLDLVSDLPVEHAIGDIMESAALEAAMRGCDWVFHVAAASDYWRTGKTRLYLVNVQGARNVFEIAQRSGVARVIFTSSGAAVGLRSDGQPSTEADAFNLPPDQFAYGHSKWLAEQEAWRFVERGSDIVAVNPSAVFGPGDLNQISGSAVVEAARGSVIVYPRGGMTVIDVRDVAKAHIAAAERGVKGERYLVGKESLPHKYLLDLTAEIVGAPKPFIPIPRAATPVIVGAIRLLNRLNIQLPINADQVRLSTRNVFFDCRKAWAAFGEPEIDVRRSLQDTYEWYCETGIIKRKN
ncbi:MAG: NAD-dependent epimerase/dehydratase family protein [Anaerolineae bacterium]